MKYVSMPGQPSFSVVSFWSKMKTVMPTLPTLAMCQLGLDATSAPSERVFSIMNGTISDNQSRLEHKKREAKLFMRLNRHWVPGWSSLYAFTEDRVNRVAKHNAAVEDAQIHLLHD
jgi:hypothetical protein